MQMARRSRALRWLIKSRMRVVGLRLVEALREVVVVAEVVDSRLRRASKRKEASFIADLRARWDG